GNLLNRTVAMIGRYFDGTIPTYHGNQSEYDTQLANFAIETVAKYEEAMEKMEFSVALTSLWQFVSRTNKYIDETRAWVVAKDEAKKDELGSIMSHLAESLRFTAIMLKPFLIKTPVEIFVQLGMNDDALKTWDSLAEFGIKQEG